MTNQTDLPIFNKTVDLLIRQISLAEATATREQELTELSMKQLVYLEAISRMGNPTFSELARQLKVTKPSVTAIVRKLEEKGFVIRTVSQDDRRSANLSLSEKGKTLQKTHDRLHQKIAMQVASTLTEQELTELVRLLEKVVSGI